MRERWMSAAIAIGVAFVLIAAASRVQPEARRGRWIARWRADVAAVNPKVVFVGNSLVAEGIDDKLFSEVSGVPALKVAKSGSGTAIWYLLLKNIVAPARPRPELVVIFFLDHQLTDPFYKTRPPYDKAIEALSIGPEELVHRIAYRRRDETTWRMRFEKSRARVRELSEGWIKKTVARAMGRQPRHAQPAIERVFGDENMKFEVVNQRQIAADDAHHADAFDFEAIVDDSFLPSIIELCRDHGMELMFVRLRRRRMAEGMDQRPELPPYLEKLSAYLEERGIPFLDYTYDSRIGIEMFAVGDHLDRARGMQAFTRMLAKDLAPYLPR